MLSFLFVASVTACAAVCNDADSPLASLIQVGSDDPNKTPLILIHGIHGTESDDSVTKLSTNPNKPEYWNEFIGKYWKSSGTGLQRKYRLFVFKYCSDRKSIKDIARVLGNEIDAKLDGEPHVILAHSMGGLVAKSYMTEYPHISNSWLGRTGGETVVGLITMATPHHGTPGANSIGAVESFIYEDNDSQITRELKRDLFSSLMLVYWGLDPEDSSRPNRSDLRWDDYDFKFFTSKRDVNKSLSNINAAFKPFSAKLIAYGGYLDLSFRPLSLIGAVTEIRSAPNAELGRILNHKLLNATNFVLAKGLRGQFGNTDGMVPFDSGLFCESKLTLSAAGTQPPPNFFCYGGHRVRRFEPGGSDIGSEVEQTKYPDTNTLSIFRTPRGFDHLDMLEHPAVLRYVVEDLLNMPDPVSSPPTSAPNIPTLFLFDVSGSMSENNKMDQAKAAGLDALREMREAGSPPTSIMTFSGDQCGGTVTRKLSTYSSNLAEAENTMRFRLPSPNGGTPLPQAKDAAFADLSAYLNSSASLKEGRIILLSDGQSTCGEIRPPGVFSRRIDFGVRKSTSSRIRFFTIGFDVPAGSAAERDLQFLASETGGKYYNATNREQLIRTLRKQVRRFVPRACNAANPEFANGLRAFADYDYTTAAAAFRNYTKANPSDWCGYYNLGLAYEASDRYKKAAENYRNYLIAAPTSPDRLKIEAKIAEMNLEYVAQFDYYSRLIASDLDYLNGFYKTVFDRSSADLAAEFDGFVYEKRDFYANLPDTLEIEARWLSNDAKDIALSIDTLAKRRKLESFDRDAVSLLTIPIGLIEEMIGRLREYQRQIER